MTILINTMITYYCVHTYLSSVTSQENTFVNICSRGCIPRKHRKINVVNYIFHILDSSAYSKQQMHFKIIFVIVNMTIVMCYFSLNFLFIIQISKNKGILRKLVVFCQSVTESSVNHQQELIKLLHTGSYLQLLHHVGNVTHFPVNVTILEI